MKEHIESLANAIESKLPICPNCHDNKHVSRGVVCKNLEEEYVCIKCNIKWMIAHKGEEK